MLEIQDKARLRWRCRRGMLELDLVLESFLGKRAQQLDKNQLNNFEALLENTDPELYAWLIGHEEPPPEYLEIVSHIRSFS